MSVLFFLVFLILLCLNSQVLYWCIRPSQLVLCRNRLLTVSSKKGESFIFFSTVPKLVKSALFGLNVGECLIKNRERESVCVCVCMYAYACVCMGVCVCVC